MITLVAHNRPNGTWTHEILRRNLKVAIETCPWRPTKLCGGWEPVVAEVARDLAIPYYFNYVPQATITLHDGTDFVVSDASSWSTRLGLPVHAHRLHINPESELIEEFVL